MLTENILDLSGNIIASMRFDDDDDPETPNEWEDQYYFYHYDIRGSVTAIIDPGGDSVKEYTYDEFGNLEETGEASFDNEVTFTGSVTDTSTGLQYMNARYYDSTTGRFLTQDTYSGNPYDPWTQHLYNYCGNNPTNFIDPTGHKAGKLSKYEIKNEYKNEYKEVYLQPKPFTTVQYLRYFNVKRGRETFQEADTIAGDEGIQYDTSTIDENAGAKYNYDSYTYSVLMFMKIGTFYAGTNMMVQFALQYDGTELYGDQMNQFGNEFHLPYSRSRGGLDKALDCSSFVSTLYYLFFGINIGGTTLNQFWSDFNGVDYEILNIEPSRSIEEQLRPTDLIYYKFPTCRHVSMYIGNGLMIHERNTSADCVVNAISTYSPSDTVGYIRILNDEQYQSLIVN